MEGSERQLIERQGKYWQQIVKGKLHYLLCFPGCCRFLRRAYVGTDYKLKFLSSSYVFQVHWSIVETLIRYRGTGAWVGEVDILTVIFLGTGTVHAIVD